MARLIDADALIQNHRNDVTNWDNPYAVKISSIENSPTVDAVELPCKVGDTIYQVDSNKIYPITIKNLIYDAGHIAFDENAIGKSVFLTRKEAEAKLGGDGNG